MSNEEWIEFSACVAMLLTKFRNEADAAKALHNRACTGALEGIASHAVEIHGADHNGLGGQVRASFTDWPIPLETWNATKQPDTFLNTDWKLSAFTAEFGGFGQPRRVFKMSGVRIERVGFFALAAQLPSAPSIFLGLGMPFAAATPVSKSAPSALQPSLPWTERQMIEEIQIAVAAVKSGDRDKVWLEYFKPREAEHGWDNAAFRDIWSKARGSQGRPGRPPKSAQNPREKSA